MRSSSTLLLILSIGLATGHSQGVLLVKSYAWHPDTQAYPVEYESAERFNTVFNIRTPAGEKKRVLSGLIVKDLRYLDISCPATVITATDSAQLASRTADIAATIQKWPSTQILLQKYLDANNSADAAMKRGYVRVNGKWTLRTAYEQDVSRQEMEALKNLAAEQQRQAIEDERTRQRRAEATQLRDGTQASIPRPRAVEQNPRIIAESQTLAKIEPDGVSHPENKQQDRNRSELASPESGRFWVVIGVILFVYFLPTVVGRNKTNAVAIFVLNLFLGWTFFGWVMALVWACTKDSAIDTMARERMRVQDSARNSGRFLE